MTLIETKMTKEEKIRLLEKWEDIHDRISEIFQKMENVLGYIGESDLFDIVWKNFNAHTEALSILLGDEEKWLEWYAFENRFGKKEYEAGCDNQMLIIKNFEDLLWIIELDCKKGKRNEYG